MKKNEEMVDTAGHRGTAQQVYLQEDILDLNP